MTYETPMTREHEPVDRRGFNFDLGLDDHDAHITDTKNYTLGDAVRKNARAFGGKTAIVDEHGGEITYRELNARTDGLSDSLASEGVSRGSTIALISENRPEFIEVVLAGAKLGALTMAQNWRLSEDELLHCLRIEPPDAIFVSGKHEEKISWIQEDESLTSNVYSFDDPGVGGEYSTLRRGGDTNERADGQAPSSEDGAVVLYTSGTTGLPKAAVISHRALFYRSLLRTRMFEMKRNPDFVGWPPMFHMGGFVAFVSVLLNSGTFYTIDGFQPELILERQQQSDSSFLIVFPGTAEEILETVGEMDYSADDYGVDYVGIAPNLFEPGQIEALTDAFDAEFFNSFGSTETGMAPAGGNTVPVGRSLDEDDLLKVESPLSDQKLIDKDWNEVERGEVGEMAVNGPLLFSGYLKNPEANRTEFKDGWFRMGDMFRRDDDGRLTFVDRRKYLIKSGGENIYPAEIERALLNHESIQEACIVRVPDEKWGEVPMAYLAPDSAEVTPDEILEYLDGKIARYKLPHYIRFIDPDEFPRSSNGKIQRGQIEEWPVDAGQRVRDV